MTEGQPNAEKGPQQPGQDQPAQQGVFLSAQQLVQIARMYKSFKWIAPLLKIKIPPEFDDAMEQLAAAGDPQAMQRLQNMANQQQTQQGPYDVQRQEIPEPRIGERVLTKDLGYLAWRLNRREGLSLREIADYFTTELGAPCSHATVANYINDYEDEQQQWEAHKHETLKAAAKIVGLVVAILGAGLALGHFFL